VADHVFELLALVKIAHDDTDSSLVFADQLDATVLDFVVIDDESAHFS